MLTVINTSDPELIKKVPDAFRVRRPITRAISSEDVIASGQVMDVPYLGYTYETDLHFWVTKYEGSTAVVDVYAYNIHQSGQVKDVRIARMRFPRSLLESGMPQDKMDEWLIQELKKRA
jgi:hypothetical protein